MFFTKKSPFDIKNFYVGKIRANSISLYVNNTCNASCDYCAIGKQKGNVGISDNMMSKETFDKILERLKNDDKIEEVEFLGKEPSMWPHIDSAIKEVKAIGKKVIYFTNGINKKEVYPDVLTLHIDKEFIKNEKLDIQFFIDFCKQNNIYLTFVVVLSAKSDLDYYYDILKLSDSFDINIECPLNIDDKGKILVNKAIDLYKKLYNTGYKKGILGVPIPYCLINEDNYKFLDQNNIKFPGTCKTPAWPVIDVDGNTMYSCLILPKKNVVGDTKYSQLWKKNFAYIDLLRNKMPLEKCYDCEYYKKGVCQGGCLINRYKKVKYS